MSDGTAPARFVRVVGWVFLVAASMGLVISAGQLTLLWAGAPGLPVDARAVAIALGLVVLSSSVIAVSVAFLKRRPWARPALGAVVALGIVVGLSRGAGPESAHRVATPWRAFRVPASASGHLRRGHRGAGLRMLGAGLDPVATAVARCARSVSLTSFLAEHRRNDEHRDHCLERDARDEPRETPAPVFETCTSANRISTKVCTSSRHTQTVSAMATHLPFSGSALPNRSAIHARVASHSTRSSSSTVAMRLTSYSSPNVIELASTLSVGIGNDEGSHSLRPVRNSIECSRVSSRHATSTSPSSARGGVLDMPSAASMRLAMVAGARVGSAPYWKEQTSSADSESHVATASGACRRTPIASASWTASRTRMRRAAARRRSAP